MLAAPLRSTEEARLAALLATGEPNGTLRAAERIQAAINARMAAAGHAVTASIGAASFATPIAAANARMYAAKAAGKNRVMLQLFAAQPAVRPERLAVPA